MDLTEPSPQSRSLRKGLEVCNQLLSRFLHVEELENEKREEERRKNSEELRRLRSSVAFQDLASVLNPEEIFERRETDLMTAAAAVGSPCDRALVKTILP
mgnify:CR=1 FL=1